MKGRWIKLYVALLDSDVWFENGNVVKLAVWCLLTAQNRHRRWRGTTLKPGQLATSWKRIVGANGVSLNTAKKSMGRLEELGFIKRDDELPGLVWTVVNWDEYQPTDGADSVRGLSGSVSGSLSDQVSGSLSGSVSKIGRPIMNVEEEKSKKKKKNSAREQLSLSDELKPDPKPTAKQKLDQATREAADKVIAAFNRSFGRSVGVKPYMGVIRRCIQAGYDEAQMRGVVWWADKVEWTPGHEYRQKLTPTTLFKLKGGNRTFPIYLDLATEAWKRFQSKEVPWPMP